MLEAGIDEAKRMANKITTITLATGVFLGCAVIKTPVVNSAPTLLGPTPYLSFNDSPFKNVSFSYFHLENFEDGFLNVPGVTASSASGLPFGVVSPSFYTDSVDIDDGVIDGKGQQGHSLIEAGNGIIGGFKFTFNANTLGHLPTHVGIVWTDSYSSLGGIDQTPLTFQGFDAQGNSLGTIALGQGQIGDKRTDGTTVDDRFFGVINLAGISAISISQTLIDVGFEVDHLQYGFVPQSSQTVSEPSTVFGLLGFGLFGLGVFCKRTVSANWM
ncbi:PEP-CTERM sorting domain-containing protein [Microcystis aeruginosa]|uniref:Ice-binding protein C-terminal domain-containing protein n=1 Tax=Microcystis aeruginosa PCC 9443 TaxID=1160281 RepID=I4G8A4_MICAE|nr:PEP-CTERM sorting domain-containing protein [Microcystis aeruginosa]CCI04165.1 hypothetical protein MICAC_5430026 [Microcystis aeruginosa PCC 9443]